MLPLSNPSILDKISSVTNLGVPAEQILDLAIVAFKTGAIPMPSSSLGNRSACVHSASRPSCGTQVLVTPARNYVIA